MGVGWRDTGRARRSLNWVDVDGLLNVDGGRRWGEVFGNGDIHNIGHDIIYNGLLVQSIMGDRSCDCQGGAKNSEDG